nr:hypothetical protein [Tanacetum cinerariifolium]
MCDEYNALVKNNTWILVPKPPNANVVRSMWLFRHKYHADGSLSSLALSRKWHVHQLDAKNAFLTGDISETAPRAWFQRFASYALRVGFSSSRCDSFLFIYRHGISVTRDSTGMFLSQKKYALELLDRAHMANCNPTRTLVDMESKLGSDGDPISDPTLYRSLAGGLQYLIFTRPDISYAVQQVYLHMHDPREPHLAALKRILRYDCGTLDFGL